MAFEIDNELLQRKLAIFKEERKGFEAYAEFLKKVFAKAAKRLVSEAFVTQRTKDLGSYAEKVVRKQDKYHKDPESYDITDCCGARVVVETTRERDTICQYIRTNPMFLIDEANSLDEKSKLKDDQFGYLSVHFIVQIAEDAKEIEGEAVPSNVRKGRAGFKAEIQVRTVLEHAWANPLHDRLYKVWINVPNELRRQAAALAAAIEESDQRLMSLAGTIDSFLGHYAAHMPAEKLAAEIAITRAAMECEEDPGKRPTIQLRLGRLLKVFGDWDGAGKAWTTALLAPANQGPCLALELGYLLCQTHAPQSTEFLRGQKMLRSVANTVAGVPETPMQRTTRAEAHHRLAWTLAVAGNIQGYPLALASEGAALALDPHNPYFLTGYVSNFVIIKQDSEAVRFMHGCVDQALARCAEHVRVKIEHPRVQFTMGRLQLLLGNLHPSLDAYLEGISILKNAKSRESEWHLEQEMKFWEVATCTKDTPDDHQQVLWLLQLALAAYRRKWGGGGKDDAAKRDEEAAFFERMQSPGSKAMRERRRILIVAGGATRIPREDIPKYGQIMRWALEQMEGVVVAGGTPVGIPGLVGDSRPAPSEHLKLMGYVPEHWKSHDRYDVIVTTRTKEKEREFSMFEPLQYWIDIFGADIEPSAVRVLGIEGGPVAAFEYRLALALGARVGLIVGSGREADKLLSDPDWKTHPGLIQLPMPVLDAATVRAFVRPAMLKIGPNTLEKLAETVHERYVKEKKYSDTDPVLRKFADLREDLKDSNRQQILYAAEILRAVGYDVEEASVETCGPLPEFTKNEIEGMAELEHGRWNIERLAAGWTYGKVKDVEKKQNKYIMPWLSVPDEPPYSIKQSDRDAVRAYAGILKEAGFRIVKKPSR